MTTSVRSKAAGLRAIRTSSSLDPARLFVSLGRWLWLRDRPVAELRWAAVAFAAMALLAVIAKVIDPADSAFDRAVMLFIPATLVTGAAAWSRWGRGVVHRRIVRLALGPAVVLVAMASSAAIDLRTLAMPATAPLVVLALTYAAITPGYPFAAFLIFGSSMAVALAHATVIASGGAVDLVSDDYMVRTAVVLLASTGMYLVVRIATEAEGRATRLAARNRARVDALEALDRIIRRFDGSKPVRDVIQAVVDDVAETFEITLVSMYLPDEHGRLSMVGVAGYHSPIHVIEVGRGVIGRAAASLETQFVPDVVIDPDYQAARDDVRSEVAVPILHHGELLGVVNFEGTLAHPLSSTHVALAEMIARSIAAALRSARLDEERRERLHAIERVLAVSRGLVSDLDRARTMRAVIDTAGDLLAADRVLVAARDHDGRFRIEGRSGSDAADPLDGRLLGPLEGPALEAVETGERLVRTVAADGDEPERRLLALPIRIGDQVAAVLTASRPASAPPFSELEVRMADLLVTQIGVALQNADRHATIVDAAVRDPLTGLLNRRYFDEAVETAFATARRAGSALSLIVFDLDRFSAVNNEYGHAVGDAALRRVARAMRDAVRAGDVVARYGGEEFVVIAPGSTAEEAVAVAERIRRAVALASATVAAGESVSVPITVSAGVAALLGDELDGHALFHAADSALLAAKRAGRDRVVAF